MDNVVVLKETYRFPSRARFTRHHLLARREGYVLGLIQETVDRNEYVIYQLMNTTTRIELRDGGSRNKAPVVEILEDGVMIFSTRLGGPRPRPLRIGSLVFIPCRWGAMAPSQIWGQNMRIEEVGGDQPPEEEGPPTPTLNI
jgi:hypothetical protein